MLPSTLRAPLAGIGLLSLSAAGLSGATAQSPQARSITEQFEAKAAERARSGKASPSVPDIAASGQEGDTKRIFVLKAVELTGATVVGHEEIRRFYRGYLGRPVSRADLARITGRITGLYRSKGYALTRAFVPPQEVKQGRIRVKVVEGYIDEVAFEGEGADRPEAHALLQPLMAERPTQLASLERRLLLLSDIPGLRIKDTSLKEIGQATGRFRLIVHLHAWRLFANIDLDNRGTPDIGPLQSFVSTAFNSVLTPGDALVFNVSTIPNSPRDLAYVGVVLDSPVDANGARLGVRGSFSDIWPDGEGSLVDTRIRTEELGIYASVVPLRTRQASLKLTAFAGLRNTEESDTSGTLYDDRVRAISLTADYQLNDAFGGSTYSVVTVRRGLPVLGASENGDFDVSRLGASGDFYKLYWGWTRYQSLGGPWSAMLSTTGQLASAPLLKSEAFYFGGPLFGRAFASGDFGGDAGVTGLAEIRFDQRNESDLLRGYQPYVFVDAGVLWNKGGSDQKSLASYGAGVRFFLQDDLRVGLEVAIPLEDRLLSNLDGGARVSFSLSKSFKSSGQFLSDK